MRKGKKTKYLIISSYFILLLLLAYATKNCLVESENNTNLRSLLYEKDLLLSQYEQEGNKSELLISQYQNTNEELLGQIDILNSENLNKFSLQELEHQDILTRRYYEYELLQYDNKIIRPKMDELEVVDSFGEAIHEEIYIDDGSVVKHQEGVYWKTCEYDEFIISYLGDRNDENYRVHSYFTESEKLSTLHGIKVGDTLEKLKDTYPTLEEVKFPDDTVRYSFPEGEYTVHLQFEIQNNTIVEIKYLGYH